MAEEEMDDEEEMVDYLLLGKEQGKDFAIRYDPDASYEEVHELASENAGKLTRTMLETEWEGPWTDYIAGFFQGYEEQTGRTLEE